MLGFGPPSAGLIITLGFGTGGAVPIPPPTPQTGGGSGGGPGYRYFTPGVGLPGRKKKRRIDQIIEREAKLKEQIVEYQAKGIDTDVLLSLIEKLKELQLLILRLALESEAAARYIEMKRDEEEEEDIRFILNYL